jgi:hypothetical protein
MCQTEGVHCLLQSSLWEAMHPCILRTGCNHTARRKMGACTHWHGLAGQLARALGLMKRGVVHSCAHVHHVLLVAIIWAGG